MPLRSASSLTTSTSAARIFTASSSVRSGISLLQQKRNMATETPTSGAGSAPSFSSIGIKNTNVNVAPGVDLPEQQKVIVGSVLDLFEGNPTLKHFSLWQPTATFTDNITVATGYPKYTAQFYGLPALFKPIELQSHQVVKAGNPIEMEMSNKYVVKGIKKEQVMNSVVAIHVGQDGKIEKVEDRWNGKLPEGAISEVSKALSGGGSGVVRIPSPFAVARWALRTGGEVAWWAFCTLSWWSPFLAFRKLNAVTVPTFVKVPKNEEEDMKMKAEREKS